MVNYRDMSMVELLSLTPPGWGGALLQGLMVSLQVAGAGFVIGIGLGAVLATLKRRNLPGLGAAIDGYTTIVRAIPELVLILLVYFALPELVNHLRSSVGMAPIQVNAFAAGVLVISLVQGAYATEVMRGAINAIPNGHLEAAQSLGMHPWQIFHRITLPEMLPNALPGLSNLWLIATKDTALLAVVGFTELTLTARQAAGVTKEYLLFLAAAGVLYLIVTMVSNQVFKLLEHQVNPVYRRVHD